MTNLILIYITNPTKKEAKKIAKRLLEKKLIACANIFSPVNSIYSCQGRIVDEDEAVLIAKTTKANFERVKNEVERVHSYATPCIIKIRASSNKKYLDWLKDEVKK